MIDIDFTGFEVSGIMSLMATYRDWTLIMTYENLPKAPSPMAAMRG